MSKSPPYENMLFINMVGMVLHDDLLFPTRLYCLSRDLLRVWKSKGRPAFVLINMDDYIGEVVEF